MDTIENRKPNLRGRERPACRRPDRRFVAATLVLLATWALGSDALAAEYVVDGSNPKATDEGPGSEAIPWKTLAKACRAARAGDTVKVAAGVYDERLTPEHSGTEHRMIVFRGIPAGQVRITGADLRGDYIRVEGFEITGDGNPGVALEGTGLEVIGNYIHDLPGAAVGSDPGKTAAKALIARNRIAKISFGVLLYGDDGRIEANDISRLIFRDRGRFSDADYTRVFGDKGVLRYNHFHGTLSAEARKAHVDCLQNFALAPPNSTSTLVARNIVVEWNVFSEFDQGYDASGHSQNLISHHVFRHNIYYCGKYDPAGDEERCGSLGLCAEKNQNAFVVEHNTYANMYWFGVSLDNGSDDGLVRGNIVTGAEDRGYRDDKSKGCRFEDNLYFGPGKIGTAGKGCITANPLFVDAEKANFRLQPGSPCIGTGPDGSTMGALEYPNVYWVDPAHPAATDDGFGYAAVPFKTLAKACATARSGETIVLRGGICRGVLRPDSGVTVRAAKGEKPVVSGADLVEGWKHAGDHWVVSMETRPTRLIRDGELLSDYTYDEAVGELRLTGFDPRLHVIESVVRDHAIDLHGRKDVKVEGIGTADTLGAARVGDGANYENNGVTLSRK